jgi:hypothetical protein
MADAVAAPPNSAAKGTTSSSTGMIGFSARAMRVPIPPISRRITAATVAAPISPPMSACSIM